MRRVILTVVLLLGYLFTTSSSTGPNDSISYITGRDSTTLEVKFQNPQLIISDERTSEAITSYLRDRDSLTAGVVDSILQLIGDTKDVMKKDQERRYESAMDYLSRETGLTASEIENDFLSIIKRRNAYDLSYALIVLSILISWWILTKHKLYEWRERIVQLFVIVAFSVALYLLFSAILRIATPTEYHLLNELLNLS